MTAQVLLGPYPLPPLSSQKHDRRDRMQFANAILHTIDDRGPSGITRLRFYVRTNGVQARKHLAALTDSRWLTFDFDSGFYALTPLGAEKMSKVDELLEMLGYPPPPKQWGFGEERRSV